MVGLEVARLRILPEASATFSREIPFQIRKYDKTKIIWQILREPAK
jgi:hypothetical protein